ncbi:hypothetical protein F8280_16060 [Micromonospora noduli]|uniref:hypothetical protein n=1 Tax=Micromonospora noduli TaxID=709876 RepID=UPI00124B8743|nr:hypothetical protein [Micromonospora noduli]KAB1923422.1 hypothetical protein F8280_16060 [Micromonospora noduli]
MDEPRRLTEVALYTDARAFGEDLQVGPYRFMPTYVYPVGEMPFLAVVVRMAYGVAIEDLTSDTHDGAYHGGDIYDELAALLSLAAGIRCQAGGAIRDWDIASDPLGRHIEWGHRRPYLPEPGRRGAVLPGMSRDFTFEKAAPFLAKYGGAPPKSATAVIRAARLYQQALWVAESDPNQAWLLLVSAGEVAAEQSEKLPKSLAARIETAWPDLGRVLAMLPAEPRNHLVNLLGPTVKAQAKYYQFFEHFKPAPPLKRPAEFEQVVWQQLPEHLVKIYKYRSRALHAGNPFPYPMCEPPQYNDSDEPPAEIPLGLWTQRGPSGWKAEDTPLLLHVFEYITRSALQQWWLQLPAISNGDSERSS